MEQEQLDPAAPRPVLMDSFCSLDGLDVALPSPEEQASKRAKALDNLRKYVAACGGSLPQGWDCSLRCRITSRRHGRQGLTTDNYYYSPCGRTFRTHKQVVEHLGLTPVSREQLKQLQQQADSDSEEELLPEHFNIISVAVLASAASGKRSHSAMTSTDSVGATAARPAASAPAAVVAASAQEDQQAVSCGAPKALPAHSSQSAPAQMPSVAAVPSTKRTKAALAAKYAASCSASLSAASQAVSTATVSVAAAAAASGLPCSSSTLSTATHAASTTASTDVVACRQPSPVLAAARQAGEQQAQLQNPLSLATPAASSNNSFSRRSSSSKAVSSSRRPAMQSVPKQPVPKQPVVKQPVPKPWKPRAQPAWRLKLRELATAAVLAEGLGPAAAPSNDGAAADTRSG